VARVNIDFDHTIQSSLTRRAALTALLAGTVLPACTTITSLTTPTNHSNYQGPDYAAFRPQQLHQDLQTYDGFGVHRSGSIADVLTADWMTDHFCSQGYDVRQQAFPVANNDSLNAQLLIGEARVDLLSQPPFKSATQNEVTGALIYAGPAGLVGDASGKIILADAPYGRPSSYESKEFRALADLALKANAKALLIISNGPTSQAATLNINLHRKYPLTALVAPDNADQFRQAALRGRTAKLLTPVSLAERTARNVIGTLTRGPRTIIVSTPTSGWTHCAGERGPGVAALRALSSWLPQAFREHTIILSAQSGHEIGHLGAKAFLASGAPPPEQVDLWVHLGAGWAARDWHETTIGLFPLDTADPQRFMLASPSALPSVAKAFSGLSGLEHVYPLTPKTAAGELKTINQAGYKNLFGMFASHRFHHIMADRMNCVSGDLLYAPLNALCKAMLGAIG